MNKFQKILTQYWGYPGFRPLQEDIIRSIYGGNDTLGLMPTGGGKSITFQVPTMVMDGICLVITPLIALMKDQVNKLLEKNIDAIAIHSGLSDDEIKVNINRCIYGHVKFLYVSPERLQNKKVIVDLSKMKFCMIAVDEAHCISQWGYDFRPSYLKISSLRNHLPDIPILALTATATTEVMEDIQKKLLFKKNNVFRISFERKNLCYIVRYKEDKYNYLLKIFHKIKESSIVYVRSRKGTKEVAEFLKGKGKRADFFHAGLTEKQKNQKQDSWTNNKLQIIVATNAFGMGIDKSDVRAVVHLDLPDSPEAYFQETGRAGRDERLAYAVLIFSKKDEAKLNRILLTRFPSKKTIRKIYNAAANFLNIGVGEDRGVFFPFNVQTFCHNFKFHPLQVYNSFNILKNGGYIDFTNELDNPSRIRFIIKRDDLYKFQVANRKFDAFIKLVLRLYTGVFTSYVRINEDYIADKAGTKSMLVNDYLVKLSQMKVIRYIPSLKSPYIEFLDGRLPSTHVVIGKKIYEERKKLYKRKIDEMIHYANNNCKCRSRFLLTYFNEKTTYPCGICDVCRKKTELGLTNVEFNNINKNIEHILSTQSQTIEELCEQISFSDKKIIKVVRWLLDKGKLQYSSEHRLKWA